MYTPPYHLILNIMFHTLMIKNDIQYLDPFKNIIRKTRISFRLHLQHSFVTFSSKKQQMHNNQDTTM
ncbi:hypothetical protein BZG78_05650 [Salinivibrio sp. MA351]|nr:hypothetical protein BZG78_05650 [Salinivibrio sp. MA351]